MQTLHNKLASFLFFFFREYRDHEHNTNTKDSRQRNLLFRLQLQTPQHREREDNNSKVQQQVKNRTEEERQITIPALSILYCHIPVVCEGAAESEECDKAPDKIGHGKAHDHPDSIHKGAYFKDSSKQIQKGQSHEGVCSYLQNPYFSVYLLGFELLGRSCVAYMVAYPATGHGYNVGDGDAGGKQLVL